MAAVCQSTSSSASQQSLSLNEYIAELDRCSTILNSSAGNPAALHDLRVSLPAEWKVTAGDATYSVATDWLTGPLAGIEKNPSASGDALAQIRQKLDAYRKAARALEIPAAPQSLAQSRTRLNTILSAREFRGQQGPSWLDALKARIWSWIIRQLERLFGGVGRAKSIGNIVAWTVIVLACLLLLFWTVRFLMRAGPRSEMDLERRHSPEPGLASLAARCASRRRTWRLPRRDPRRVLGGHRADGRDEFAPGGSLAHSAGIAAADSKGERGVCAAFATDAPF